MPMNLRTCGWRGVSGCEVPGRAAKNRCGGAAGREFAEADARCHMAWLRGLPDGRIGPGAVQPGPGRHPSKKGTGLTARALVVA